MKDRWQIRRTEGQSLVELAIALPLLLLMFAGLVEIGAALRDYLVVVNATREGSRLAARGRWFDTDEEVEEIFERIVIAAGCQRCDPENYAKFLRPEATDGWPANTYIHVTYIRVPDQLEMPDPKHNMHCSMPHPCYDFFTWSIGTAPNGAIPVDPASKGAELAAANKTFNETYFLSGDLETSSEDNTVIVEVWYEHEQLLKLPIFTRVFPERFTLYSRSEMRVTIDSRLQ